MTHGVVEVALNPVMNVKVKLLLLWKPTAARGCLAKAEGHQFVELELKCI